MGRNRNVIVIGGGASGMMAAIHAAKAGARVTILEHMDRVGKKILSTGNGRCNLTNLYQADSCYRSSQKGFPMEVISQFPAEETLEFFKELGILPKSKDGYIYPNSEQASAVLDVLRMELEHRRIEVVCSCKVQAIQPPKTAGGLFRVETDQEAYHGDAVILAAGSRAAPVTGSDGSGYRMAKQMGHRIIPPLPGLVQLRCREKHYKQLAGIRTEAKLTLFADGKPLAEEQGELQLTDYGISGIPTFQISRYAAEALFRKQQVRVRIDFLPNLSEAETEELVNRRVHAMGHKTCEGWMTGLFNKKLAGVLLKLAGIRLEEPVSAVESRRWKALLQQIKAYETEITATNPYENAQICCGGVDTRQVDPQTMESRLVPGLYLAGELLDVDGICGGYNLQWAWSSGQVAGLHAGRGK